ncbi:hypothetical protein VJJ00_08810, partial [Parvimonas micra]
SSNRCSAIHAQARIECAKWFQAVSRGVFRDTHAMPVSPRQTSTNALGSGTAVVVPATMPPSP